MMSPLEGVWPRTKKQACTDAGTTANPAHLPPTTFFLRSEKEMQQAEASQSASHGHDNDFGVQSLSDTLETAFAPGSPDDSSSPSNTVSGKKRKVGNPVHPKIAAAAQRIISSEHPSNRPSSRASSVSSPVPRPLTPSPTRRHVRSESVTSLGRSFTPLRSNEINLPSTPRSASVRSVRLSDEEGSIIDDTTSQPLHSSSDDEDALGDDTLVESACPTETLANVPQLVMPSISMPARRPFTERGKRIPKLKLMIAGPSGVGKTSLIKSMVQVCEDIVHVDPTSNASPPPISNDTQTPYAKTGEICETHASTRSYPSWWSEIDQGRGLRRRKSMGESILERNICFIDTPGWDMSGASDQENMEDAVGALIENIEVSLRRNTLAGDLNDSDLLSVFSGGGGFQVDAMLYMFHPTSHHISPAEINILRRLSTLTNIIPIIGRADTCSRDHLQDAKTAIKTTLEAAGIKIFTFNKGSTEDSSLQSNDTTSPFAVSSALGEDTETMDASVLMSSGYVQPLIPSDLSRLVDRLFDPNNVQWLRHCAVNRFLQWRRDHIGTSLDLHKRELRELAIARLDYLHTDDLDAAPSSISSMPSSPSGILMPNLQGSGHRGSSPAPFRLVPAAAMGTASQYDFGRQIDIQRLDRANARLPTWAHDLKIALEVDNQERKQLTLGSSGHDDTNFALVKHGYDRSAGRRGKTSEFTGGMDPRDPLGLLAIGQRINLNGWTMLQVAGGCGAVATFLVWTIRNWETVTEIVGLNSVDVQVPGYAVVSAKESRLRGILTGWKF